MGWTKKQLIAQAFEELGLASYIYALSPEQLNSARQRMDSMVATWDADGVRCGYPLPSDPDSGDLDDSAQTPDAAAQAIYTNLAVRLAPSYGKAASAETKAAAQISLVALTKLVRGMPPERQFPRSMPRGAGSKYWRNTGNPFMDKPNTDPIQIAGNGDLDLSGD